VEAAAERPHRLDHRQVVLERHREPALDEREDLHVEQLGEVGGLGGDDGRTNDLVRASLVVVALHLAIEPGHQARGLPFGIRFVLAGRGAELDDPHAPRREPHGAGLAQPLPQPVAVGQLQADTATIRSRHQNQALRLQRDRRQPAQAGRCRRRGMARQAAGRDARQRNGLQA
jgi:hypothetical protein